MTPSAKFVTHIDDEWTIVCPRRGRRKQRTSKSKVGLSDEKNQPHDNTHAWAPIDLEVDKDRELKLMQKMEMCMKKLESSQFYKVFIDQIENLESKSQVLYHFSRFRHTEPKMKMVIYGIGSIESFESPRLQLSLAILLHRKLDWIGEIEVFDPILSATESRVLEALGCSVLSVNEHGRREASRPMLFFMPHCESVLYNNLLEANWKVDRLRNMVLFGNSFGAYEEHVSLVKDDELKYSRKYILAARRFTDEFEIKTVSDDYFRAFHESSWHFFSPNADPGLPII